MQNWLIATAQEAYAMLGKQPLWATATRVHEVLAAQSIPHAVVGGMAVCLHGYQRNTVGMDVLIPNGRGATIRDRLQAAGITWDQDLKEFRSESNIPVQFLTAGDRAGSDSEVRLPDPQGPDVVVIEGLPVISLARLIEAKIACGEGNIRRTHKDFADVVELIACQNLGADFARHLHKSVRRTYRRLVKNAQGDA